jgi:putative transposase
MQQTAFHFRAWGGARAGAGRPKTSKRVAHVTRPRVTRHVPSHVTLRLVAGLPNLREKRTFRLVRELLGLPRAGDAHIVHYSVQSNHLHFVLEAESARQLARGMQALSIRLAKRLNRLFERWGRVFADRFHLRPLRTPREVRRALAYVLNNYRRHADSSGPHLPLSFLDPCSSAASFDGWDPEWTHAPPDPRSLSDPFPKLSPGVVPARSFLLRKGWRRHGLIRPFDCRGG